MFFMALLEAARAQVGRFICDESGHLVRLSVGPPARFLAAAAASPMRPFGPPFRTGAPPSVDNFPADRSERHRAATFRDAARMAIL